MASKGELSFTLINSLVCNYCADQVRTEPSRFGPDIGCGLVQNDQGQFARLVLTEPEFEIINKDDPGMAISIAKGCDKFNPSGLPAHPSVIEELILYNPRAEAIPVDPNATETSYDFDEKSKNYLGKIISGTITTPEGETLSSII